MRISTAAYWSLISLLGSTIDSSRSARAEPAGDAGEVGAVAPALVVEAVAGEALGGGEELAAAVEVAAGFSPFSSAGTRSSSLYVFTNGRAASSGSFDRRRVGVEDRLRVATSSRSVSVATASALMSFRKLPKLARPCSCAAFRNQVKYSLRSSGVQPVLSIRSDADVLQLLLLRRGVASSFIAFGATVSSLQVNEYLQQLRR